VPTRQASVREDNVRKRAIAVVVLAGSLLWSLSCAGAGPTPPAPAAGAPSPSARPTSAPPTAGRQAGALPQAAAPARLQPVRVSRSQGVGSVLAIAAVRGYFQEQGIDFNEVEFASTADAIPALATSELDAGSTSPGAGLFNAFARGIRMHMALASSAVEAGGNGFPLVSRLGPDGPVIRGPSDLRGKRMGQGFRGAINEWALDRVLDSAGLRLDDVEIVTMSFPDQVTALGAGQIDGAVLPEPFGTVARQRGVAGLVLNADDYIAGGQVAVMSYSERFVRERPELARGFAVAYLRATHDFMDAMEYGRDREEIVNILAQGSGVPAAVIDKAGYFPIPRDGRVNAEGLQAMLDWLAQHGYVPQKPDLAALIDTQFADHAVSALDGGGVASRPR
jgi:NitT/TauT family transport system substrate-binding protein